MPFDNQRSDFSISVNILHDLMESRGDNGITMNPWSFQQQVIQSVGVNNIARHLGSQVLIRAKPVLENVFCEINVIIFVC